MARKYLPAYRSKAKCFLLFGGMFFIYLLDNLSVGSLIGYQLYNNALKPILWITIVIFIRLLPESRPKGSIRVRENITLWAFIFGVIYIMISMAAGLIDGFGKSPYSRTFTGMLLNIWMVGSMIAGRESARGFIVNNSTREEKFSLFILISILMTLINYPISKFTVLKDGEEIVQFIAQSLAPDFSQNLLATYLAFLGGWIPSFVYMGVLQAFHWLSPILPNLKWITTGLIGIMCPVFSLSIMQNVFLKETRAEKKAGDKEGTIGWIITSILSIGIIWFSVGVFPIYPSVIATGSMEPLIKPGDMILVDKITKVEDIKELAVGDIIQFRKENILISHRIMDIIYDENNNMRYSTKGDNNSSIDSFYVLPEDIKGKIVYVVPKVGWPTLLIKKRDDAPLEEIEF